MYTRITDYAQAETALVKATGHQFPCEDNWILRAIVQGFKYKLPEEFVPLFFNSREGYQSTGLRSHLGQKFTLALKILQSYTLERALEALDPAAKSKWVSDLQTDTYLADLQEYRAVDQIMVILDRISLSTTGNQIVRAGAKTKRQQMVFGTDFQGQLEFLTWFLNSLRDRSPSKEIIEQLKVYADSLYYTYGNADLIDLLQTLYTLYHQPSGYFKNSKPVRAILNENLQEVKSSFAYDLKSHNISLTASTTLMPEQNTQSYWEVFGDIIKYYESIYGWDLEHEYFVYEEKNYNFAETFYKILDHIALQVLATEPMSLVEAFRCLGLDPKIITTEHLDVIIKFEKTVLRKAQNQVERENANLEKLFHAFLKKYQACRVIQTQFDFNQFIPAEEASDSDLPTKQQVIAMLALLDISLEQWPGMSEASINSKYRLKSAKHHPDKGGDLLVFLQITDAKNALVNLKNKGISLDDLPQEAQQKKPLYYHLTDNTVRIAEEVEALRADYIVKAKSYLEYRWLSTWLIKQGLGTMVQFFSPLRYQKIILTQAFLDNLQGSPVAITPSSTQHMMQLLKPDSKDHINDNYEALRKGIIDAIKTNKKSSIEQEVTQNHRARYSSIQLPFFWRFGHTQTNEYDLRDAIYKDIKQEIEHNGHWDKTFNKF